MYMSYYFSEKKKNVDMLGEFYAWLHAEMGKLLAWCITWRASFVMLFWCISCQLAAFVMMLINGSLFPSTPEGLSRLESNCGKLHLTFGWNLRLREVLMCFMLDSLPLIPYYVLAEYGCVCVYVASILISPWGVQPALFNPVLCCNIDWEDQPYKKLLFVREGMNLSFF